MKILVLTSDCAVTSGWGRYSHDLTTALRAQGHDITVVTSAKGGGGVAVLPQPLEYRKNYLFAGVYARKIEALARECDVIHAHVETYAQIARLLSHKTGIPYVVTVHGTYGILPFRLPFSGAIHAQALHRARAIIAVSRYTKRLLEARNLGQVTVINNGIAHDRVVKEGAPFSKREDLIVTVGALKRRKGQHVSLEAFATLLARIPSARYCIVGVPDDAHYVSYLQNRVATLGIEKSVEFRVRVTEEELEGLYCRSKAFVLSSLQHGDYFEGFGLVYLEANACGVPVVGSQHSGAEDAIVDGETGYLVPQEDVRAVATALEQLLTDEGAWTRMSNRARMWAKEHDWQTIAKQYTDLYQRL